MLTGSIDNPGSSIGGTRSDDIANITWNKGERDRSRSGCIACTMRSNGTSG